MNRSHLGLVLTGGTIGSTAPTDANAVKLVKRSGSAGVPSWLSGPLASFGPHQLTVITPLEFHSEEARPSDWEKIAVACRRLADSGCDAILVLHGSDTMGYSAAALSFALCDLKAPVVLTGSNYPPDHPFSDARNNVRGAVAALRTLPSGTYLVFSGFEDGPAAIHLGTRVRKERASGSAFASPNGGPVAQVVNGQVEILKAWTRPSPPKWMESVPMKFDDRVLELRIHPGMPFTALRSAVAAGGIRGVVCELYPCATGPTGNDGAALDQFARFLTARGGVIAGTVAIAPDLAGAFYPSLPIITGAGIRFLPGMLTVAATVKLMWALSATGGDAEKTRELMRLSVAGEVTQDLRAS